MIHGDLASSILYTVAGALFIAAVAFALVAWWAMRDRRDAFTPLDQMRHRTPWPPPPPLQDSGWVEVVYDKPQRAQPLALPRAKP